MFDLRSALKLFVYFTVLTKIVFIISAAAHANAVRKGDKSRAKETLQWKEHTHNVFEFCVSLLIIFLFSPRTNNLQYMDSEMELIMYLFGWLTLLEIIGVI